MHNFRITGGTQLRGSITTNASKNAAVVLLHAALLNRAETILRAVPKIEEVNRIIEVLTSIGVTISWTGDHTLKITPPRRFNLSGINYESANRTRSVLFLLSTIAHFQQSFKVPQPGGCRLGARTVQPHVYALEGFGIKITTTSKYYTVRAPRLKANPHLVLYESGDTVTENAILAAATTPGRTVIEFASANYQVQDLCYFLQQLGVSIKGIGTTTLEISGKRRLNRRISYTITEDPIESMMFISIAATTNSSITIRRCPIDFLELELLKLEKMGWRYKILRRYRAHNGHGRLVDIKTMPSQLKALKEKIYARPFPGLNIDNLPFFVPIATQARGTTMIFDWVYEERAIYYTELNKLGAKVALLDPHRATVFGPTKLHATEVICPPALRPSTIIMVAMLAARGTSILRNVYSIERGYEDLCNRLKKIGAKIEKIN